MNQDVEVEKYVLTLSNGDVYTTSDIGGFNEVHCVKASTTFDYEFYVITKSGEKSEIYKSSYTTGSTSKIGPGAC